MSTASPKTNSRLILSGSEATALEEFVAKARAMLGADLKEARLFGSRARGQGHEDSDLDVALVVSDGMRARRRELYDLAFDVGFAHSVQLAPLVLEAGQLRRLRESERLIARDLDADGIPL